ncbi:PAS domain S-box/diguanylate cyclase (GGDEF) domain-containing protein [Methylophilaceae bacterium 11]|nr:PAS domain S-box/diguanylate cyclase (GGDEF) domain-containing protein [Methylophilaceae bacterium 11]
MKKLAFFQRFLLPLLLVGLFAVLSTTVYMFTLNMREIEADAHQETNELAHLLTMAKSLVEERVHSSMELLKKNSEALGTPHIRGTVVLNGETIPNLTFAEEAQIRQSSLVDGVTSIGNGTATLFVKHHDAFIRIATNVKIKNSARAVGTQLDPTGKAIPFLRKGKAFYGVVDILGEPYISGYEPMFDQSGIVIGAWYVGYKVDVKALDQAIKQWSFLDTGFAAIRDYNHQLRFVSERTQPLAAQSILNQTDDRWVIIKKRIPDWNFDAYIAYPKHEAYLQSIGNLYPILVLGSVFGCVLLLLASHAIKRFVLKPLGGDPETAYNLVHRIEQGDFNDDGTHAPPDTLIGNMLTMRQRIHDMVTELTENADRLRVSSSVFEHAHDGIFITDSTARIIEVNPAFTVITGFSREEALGKNPETLGFAYQIEAFFSQFFESTKQQGEWQGEVWNRHQNGETYIAWLDVFPVHAKTGEFQHYVGLFSDITQAKEQQKSLEHLAYHDALTKLPNRILFSNSLQKTLAHAERTKEVVAICYLDLDEFKPINDQFGHEVGDQLLVMLAERLQSSLRKQDTVARLGGDEFALLLSGLHSTTEYTETLDRILAAIEAPFYIANHAFSISASIGYTVYPGDKNPPDTLLRHADHAMYHAKTHGGKQYHLFDLQLAQLSRDKHQLKEDIAKALSNNQLSVYFQPQINVRTGQVVGMEALIRWQHPQKGLLLPNDFLPLIENTHQIIDISEWVIENALDQLKKWHLAGFDFYVAVNIAAHHLLDKGFETKLAAMLSKFPNVPPHYLNLEITESAAIGEINNVTHIIQQCKKLGVTFAIDDFGAGYSSLTYLRRLPVDSIKIDRSFINGMLVDSEDLAVVSSIITLCKEFKRTVIAEGVESADHAQKLMQLGCDLVQGHSIAKPMPANKVMQWAKAHAPFKFS